MKSMPRTRPVVTFDSAKSAWNRHERGLPFTMAERFDFGTSVTVEDDREDYGEERFVSVGKIGRNVVVLVHTPTLDGFRVISLRMATKKERAQWLATHP